MHTPEFLYLDYNATAPLHPEVLDAMRPWLQGPPGNPLSSHQAGRRAKAAIDEARAQVASLIGAQPNEILFESGGSEAINHVIKGLTLLRTHPRKRMLYGATEHHAVEDAIRWTSRMGFIPEKLNVSRSGMLQLETLEDALLGGPAFLLAIQWANNEVGTLHPVPALARRCKEDGVLVLCDAVQAVGKVPVDVADLDFLALSGHKLGGPAGIGALYMRQGWTLEPLIHGAQQEGGMRAGTHPVALIVGLGAAAALAQQRLLDEQLRLTALRDHLEMRLVKHIQGVRLHGTKAPRLPNTLAFSIDGLSAWELQAAIDVLGVCVSAGSACHSGVAKPSAVLRAMGVDESTALGGIRVSFGAPSTRADAERAFDAIADAAALLRRDKNRGWLTPK